MQRNKNASNNGYSEYVTPRTTVKPPISFSPESHVLWGQIDDSLNSSEEQVEILTKQIRRLTSHLRVQRENKVIMQALTKKKLLRQSILCDIADIDYERFQTIVKRLRIPLRNLRIINHR